MSYQLITLGREFESLGSEIGQAVAERLELAYYDRFLITAAVEGTDINLESADAANEKLESRFAYSQASAAYYYTGTESPLPTGARLARMQFDLIRKAAVEGPCLIVGRCAGHILRERTDVLKVFVHADRDWRVQRAMESLKIPESEAARVLRQTDKARRAYHKNFTGLEWDDMDQYHMVLNSGLLPFDTCVDMICSLYQGK